MPTSVAVPANTLLNHREITIPTSVAVPADASPNYREISAVPTSVDVRADTSPNHSEITVPTSVAVPADTLLNHREITTPTSVAVPSIINSHFVNLAAFFNKYPKLSFKPALILLSSFAVMKFSASTTVRKFVGCNISVPVKSSFALMSFAALSRVPSFLISPIVVLFSWRTDRSHKILPTTVITGCSA